MPIQLQTLPERKRPFGRLGECDNVKIDPKINKYERVDWIH
jgi:hypothetical protein